MRRPQPSSVAVSSRRRAPRGGFTLLEVLLAMALLVFGMAAVLGLFTFASALARTAQLRTGSALAIEAVTADLEESFFPIVHGEAGEPRAIVDREVAGISGLVYSAVPHQNPDRPIEYRVDVEMRWKSGGVQREQRFTTLLLREIPFGERLRRRFVLNDTRAFESAAEGGAADAPATPPSGSTTPASTPSGSTPSGSTMPARAPDDPAPRDENTPKERP